MSVCVETSTTALIQPVASSLSTSTNISELVVSSSACQTPVSTVGLTIQTSSSNELKPDQHLAGKSITKLVVTTQQQHGTAANCNQVLQKVVNSPLITVLNSTGPLTVVKSLCVTSVVSSAPQYTLVNTAASNTVGKAPTITVLNCGPLAAPVTVVKTITAHQAVEKSNVEGPVAVSGNLAASVVAPAIIENRGHNVFVKNTCPDSTISDALPQSHKLLTATNFSHPNVINNITTGGKSTVNGQRNKLKILSNVQIAGSSQQNVMLNKNTLSPQPRFNLTSRQKLVGANNASIKYMQKSPNNVLKSMVNTTVKSPQEKSAKIMHSPIQKGPVKSLPPSTFISKPPQGIKTLSPQNKNIPGQIQRTGSGLRTIPPQRPQKMPTKTNYIGKHAVQAQKIKHAKLKNIRAPSTNMYGYHQPAIHEKQLTFNQALTAQIIETLSNTSTPPPSNRYELLPARYDSAFNCPDKYVSDPVLVEEKGKSGLDTLSMICQAVLLDHNYNATLPSESPPRQPQPINSQTQLNGVSPTNTYSAMQNKRRPPLPNSLPTSSHSALVLCPSNNMSLLGSHLAQDEDAASDVSDGSERKHDTEGEETDTAPEAEDVKNEDHYGDYVTRCICGFLHDDGYMVECDKCKVWQHVQCVVKNRQIPDEYLCELCDPSKPVDRQKARLIQQQWIRDRQLIEPKLRKDAKIKENLRTKDHNMTDSDSSDGERMIRNNNITAKSRTASALRRKSENLKKKEIKEPVQRRQKRKEKKIVKRKVKAQIKPQQSHSDDENQDTWSAHLPQLRQWIEKYEEAVTNHYSPELRARISSIRVNGAHVDTSPTNYDTTVCKCRIHTQPLTEIKYLVSTAQLAPNTAIIELRGKYMLASQQSVSRNSGTSLTTRQNTQKSGPFLFFYKLTKDNTEVCVDTRTYGNSARFIRRSCKPNAELRHCIEKGVLHLFIVSTVAVEKNSELTIKHEANEIAHAGSTQIACACGCPEDCTVNKTTIKKNGEAEVTRKRRGRRTTSSSVPSPNLKSPVKEQPPTPISEPVAAAPLPPLPAPDEMEMKEVITEEKIEVSELMEVKIEIKEEELEFPDEKPNLEVKEKKPIEEIKELKKEESQPDEEPPKSPPPPPIKTEIKKEKSPKEERVKSPPSTPISTRRHSQLKTEKEEIKTDPDVKQIATKSSKKLSREERKLQAILRAIDQMERADQKKQVHQAKQAHRRESEPGPNSKEEDKPEPKVKRRRRRGRARTTSTNAQVRRNRLNSTDSYMTSGDENLLSPNDSNRSSLKDDRNDSKDASLLLALANGDSDGQKDMKKSPTRDLDSSSNSAHSSPETPQLSSACLLVQAAVEPLESGFKFPKTKKGLMNEWLNKTPDPTHSAGSFPSSSLLPHLSQMVEENANSASRSLTFTQGGNFCDGATQQRGGNAKKRWLRQAISEDHSGDSPIGRPDSPTMIEAVAPPKKRRLPRESISNDNSPPSTPTSTGPAKFIDTPRSSQEGSVEIVYSGAEGDSPSHTLESDAELKERAAKMQQEFGKTVTLSSSEPTTNSLAGFLTGRLPMEHSMFSSSDHLVGTVEKTLSIFGFKNTEPEVTVPAKRKVKLSITEYRQRKKMTNDKSDGQDCENDSQANEDNNSCESFKNDIETLPKPRSRSSSSSSSCSSLDELPAADIVMKTSVFNSEPTELERQRELASMRLKKAFGLDESRKPPVINVSSILKCDLESKPIPISNIATFSELSMSPTLRAPPTPERAYTPVLPPIILSAASSSPREEEKDTGKVDNKMEEKEDKVEESMEVDQLDDKIEKRRTEEKAVEAKGDVKEMEENLFYTPDEEEDRTSDTISYVPPFNNPVYPNSNFGGFASTIDDDSRYQSRNPSPPPDLEATTFTTAS